MSKNDEYENNLLFSLTAMIRSIAVSVMQKMLKPVKELIECNAVGIEETNSRIDKFLSLLNQQIEKMSEGIGENRTLIRKMQKEIVNHAELEEALSNIEINEAGLDEATQEEHDKMMSMQGTITQCLTDIKEAIENHNL